MALTVSRVYHLLPRRVGRCCEVVVVVVVVVPAAAALVAFFAT
jgi:hypothetical protein